MTKLFEDIKEIFIVGLQCMIIGGDKPYTCDLHDMLLNSDGHYIYYAEAEEATAELGVFDCIGAVQTYDQEKFGKVITPLHNPCAVANAIVYIIGQRLLYQIYDETVFFGDRWDEQLNTDDLKEMLAIAENWFEENPDGLNGIWLNLPIN